MQYRGVARRGTLVFGGVSFGPIPAIYEMSADEVSVLQELYGDRVSLELLEPEPSGRSRERRRGAAAEGAEEPEQEPEAVGN